MEILNPYAPLASIDVLTAYLKRDLASNTGDLDQVIRAANKASAWMAGRTTRRLVGRTYRNPVTLTGLTTTQDSPAVTGAGFLALKADDDAVGAQLSAGSRILSITDDGHMTLNRPAAAGSAGGASITFGSAPLQMDGPRRNQADFYIPEYPLNALYSIVYIDASGLRTSMDLTNARIQKETGRVHLLSSGLPWGSINIEVEAHCGYLQPTASRLGHWDEWSDLQGILLRATQVIFQDMLNSSGRIVSKTIGPAVSQLPDFKMPDDIESAISGYARL